MKGSAVIAATGSATVAATGAVTRDSTGATTICISGTGLDAGYSMITGATCSAVAGYSMTSVTIG
jgi:hypothetical protein